MTTATRSPVLPNVPTVAGGRVAGLRHRPVVGRGRARRTAADGEGEARNAGVAEAVKASPASVALLEARRRAGQQHAGRFCRAHPRRI